MQARAISVRTDDGWLLHGEHRPNPDAPAVVVCGHAMMVDRRTLDRPAGFGVVSVLQKRGLEPIAFDARGHGQSGPTAAQGGRFSYDDFVRQDVPAMVRLGRERAEGRPVFVLGHSLIGHAALIAAGLGGAPDGIVAFAPNLWAPSLEPALRRRLLKGAAVNTWAWVTRARGYFDPSRWNLGTSHVAAAYVEQFRAMWREDRLGSPDGAVDYADALSRAELPVLAYSSTHDTLFARPDSVRSFLGLATRADIDHRVLCGPRAPDHMGFVTDPRSEPLWVEAADWMLERAG